MERVKWAVLGAGGIARRRTIPEGILQAPNAELVAVYDTRGCAEIAAEFETKGCDSEDALLDSGCDAVYIATPVHLHRGQVIKAATAGKHVLCEKPLGLNVVEAEAVVAACEDAGVKLAIGLLMRFHAYHRKALRLIESGRIGQPVMGRAQLSCWYPPMDGAWRQDPALGGGGSLMDMGCHCIDLLEMFLGKARRVTCSTAQLVHDYASEDTATVVIEHASGARGVVDTVFNVPDAAIPNRLELYGSCGSILAEGTIGQNPGGEMVLHAAGAAGYDAVQEREDGGTEQVIAPEPVNTFQAEIEAFSKAIQRDGVPPVSGADGLWNQRVVEACYESAKCGRAIDLPADGRST